MVELSPEREYLVVTEFLDGASEIGKAPVDNAIIDQGLRIIRKLWEAGLAHRDVKPANLLVRDGRRYLIDVFFTEVRPSPWRQGVDLANMLLLALRSEPRRVYERDLYDEFVRLLPSRPRPIAIQRFSPRCIGLTLAVLTGAFLAVGLVVSNLDGLGLTPG